MPSNQSSSLSPGPNDLSIALRKGTRSCTQKSSLAYPIERYMSLSHLPSPLHDFALSLQTHTILTSTTEALSRLEWKKAMNVEMEALVSRQMWSLVDLPLGEDVVKCRWVYTIKYNPDGSIERLKARLVAKGTSVCISHLSLAPNLASQGAFNTHLRAFGTYLRASRIPPGITRNFRGSP